jgi:hypothetical protein
MSGVVMVVTPRLCSTAPVRAALVSGCSPFFEADLPDLEDRPTARHPKCREKNRTPRKEKQ